MTSPLSVPPRVSVIIPAYNEQDRIGATATAARAIPGAAEVIVVDDGSRDATAQEAQGARTTVIRARHRGKSAALRRGVAAATGELVLLLDADLGESAANVEALVEPVAADRADMTVAVLPPGRGRGGFGLALSAARIGLWLLTGREFAAPLSGQRCLNAHLARSLPWGRGFGAEVAATADAAAAGARIEEIPVELTHAALGRTLAGFIHRGRQFGAIIAAVIPRLLYPIGPTARAAGARRLVVAGCSWAILAMIGQLLPVGQAPGGRALLAMIAGGAAFCIAATLVSLGISRAARIIRPNYLGRALPAAGGAGFILVPWAATLLAPWETLLHAMEMLAAGATVMGAAGLADDLWGARDVSGLRGHFGALARGRVTTGAIKAIVGVVVAIAFGVAVGFGGEKWRVPNTVATALVVALSANFVNLLDLRPGRGFKGFVLLAVIAVYADRSALWIVGPVGAAALAFAPLDFGGRAMMGDVGANTLGIMAGFALGLWLPLWAKAVVAAALIAIHLYSERRSVNDLIERVAPLRWLDRLGRAGETPPNPRAAKV
jgi:UDP-N-acetylmuramyl pentapeptide phosphotransferase/UDP-N-acetylglucosamine-1-phosphate transferase